jgi:hypothetical protein
LPGALEAVVVLAVVAVRAVTEQAQWFYLLHSLLPLVLAAVLAVRVQLILPELGQEPMAAPATILLWLLLLQ